MNTVNINCICGKAECAVKELITATDSVRWDSKDIQHYFQRRARTIERIYQLNKTLFPPLRIGQASFIPSFAPQDWNRPITSTAEKASQTLWKHHKDNKPDEITSEGELRHQYLCHLCGKDYRWRTSLRRHIKAEHQDGKLVCPTVKPVLIPRPC